jgi:MYXO-CTERM domain-containing protein
MPVLGAGLSVLVLDGKSGAISGELQPVAQGSVEDLLTRRQAEQALASVLPTARARRAHLAFRQARGAKHAQAVWVMDVATSKPFGLWRTVQDARSGNLLWGLSTIVEAEAMGKAYGTNPSVSKVIQVRLKGLNAAEALEGELADAKSCAFSYQSMSCERHATPDADGNFYFEPDEPGVDDAFSEVHAYYHVDTFHRWLASRFDFARKGEQQITVMVNLHAQTSSGSSHGVPNAFFGDMDGDGRGDLVFGQGYRDFAYDADVIYHEFTHSAVDETSNLTYDLDELGFNMMPVALNEGFADLFSSIFAGDPKVGEYAGNGGIRQLTGMATCPDDLSGESHSDGLIWGRANWTIYSKAADKETFEEVLYKTMAGLSQNAGMADAAAMLIKVAQVTDPALAKAVKAEYADRGLLDCSRIVPLEQEEGRRGFLLGLSVAPGLKSVPGPVQYEIQVPEHATELTIKVQGIGGHWGTTTTVGAYVREKSPVSFARPQDPVYDFVISNTEPTLTLNKGDKDNPLVPGSTYYLIALNVGNYDTEYQVSWSVVEDPPPLPDTEVAPADGGVIEADGAQTNPQNPDEAATSGCSCSVPSAGGPPLVPLFLAAIALLALLRRRR